MIRFSISNVAFEEGTTDGLYRLLLGVCADLAISINGRQFVVETAYPVVELARQIQQEVVVALEASKSFSVTSVELEDPVFISFDRTQPDGYLIGSTFQQWEHREMVSRLDLLKAFQRFTADVLLEAWSVLDLDLRQAIFE